MPAITFNFDANALTRPRPLDVDTPASWGRNARYAIPNTGKLYGPVRRFIQDSKALFGGKYPFQMYRLLHITAVKMMGGKLNKKQFETALFATGGLYLAFDQDHKSLAIDQSFGDFTSGFSHQFGVALAVMTMSEAYKIPWDRVTPIPVRSKATLDYEIELPNNSGWLHLEAKGTTTKSRAAARRGAYDKKSGNRVPDTAMIAVITQAVKDSSKNGVLEIIDPEFELNQEARQPNNQIAGRYLHYAGVARFAGLDAVAREFIGRARNLVDGYQPAFVDISTFDHGDNVFEGPNDIVTGIQWRLGDANTQGEVWFYQGVEVDSLKAVVTGEFPSVAPYQVNVDYNYDTHSFYEPHLERNDRIESYLPDGSYFGIGIGPRDGLLTIDRRDSGWDERRIGYISWEGWREL